MLLNAFDMNTPGHQSTGLWRHPRDRSHEYTSMRYWQDLARTLERGLFDGIFLADVTGVYDVYAGTPDAALRGAVQVPTNDPFLLVPVMAAVTEHLCFGVTGSIPYLHPYSFARLISSLDHLTDGRIGWNVVTGYLNSAAKGTGQQHQAGHDTRYDIADEFMDIVYKLWEGSWDDDAVVRDAKRGVYTDPTRVRAVQHDGEYYALEAMHLCEPSPQRSPVIYQAGASPRGQEFAARHAECVFLADANPKVVARNVRSLRERIASVGRRSEEVKLFALMSVVVGETDAQAQAKFDEFQRLCLPHSSLALLSGWTGVDLSVVEPDEHTSDVTSDAIHTALNVLGSRSPREWGEFLTVGGAAPVLVGSPETVADGLQEWQANTGVDGFNLAYTVMPEGVTEFVDLVVPELQRRGCYRTRYETGTMREKLHGRGPRLAPPHPAVRYRAD